MKTKKCALESCKTEFIAFRPQTKYCSGKCQRKSNYLKKNGIKAETRKCEARDCKTMITTTSKRIKFCSDKCSQRERRNTMKDNGTWESRTNAKKFKKECQHRNCKKTFETVYHHAKYCSRSCGRKETVLIKNETKKPMIELECKYRYCQKPFTTRKQNVRYCSQYCYNKERTAKDADNRREERGSVRQYQLHNLDAIRYKRDINKIPKMSAKWLQDLWDKRKEMECA